MGAGCFRLVLQGYETAEQLPVYLVSGHVSRLRWRLFLLCFPGFVELNHMLTSCNPPPSANSTSGPLRLPQKQRGESERANDGIEDTSCLDVPENFGTQREFVPDWLAPGPFFFLLLHTYTHTSFQTPFPPAWMTAPISGPQKNFYLNNEEKVKVKLYQNPLTVTNPAELLKRGNMDTRKSGKSKTLKLNRGFAVGDLFRKVVLRSSRGSGGGRQYDLWRPIYKTWKHTKGLKKKKKILASRECDIFRTQTWRRFGMAIFSSECLSVSREYRCEGEP